MLRRFAWPRRALEVGAGLKVGENFAFVVF